MFILTKAAQPTTSVDTSSWFDQAAGGGQPKDVSSLFADDAESVPAQASQAAQVTMPAGAVPCPMFRVAGEGSSALDPTLQNPNKFRIGYA